MKYGVIFFKEDNKICLCEILIPKRIEKISCHKALYMRHGEINSIGNLKLNEEYFDLSYENDFEIIQRIPQVVHINGLIYDDLIYDFKLKGE
jgi:hypothetical protein